MRRKNFASSARIFMRKYALLCFALCFWLPCQSLLQGCSLHSGADVEGASASGRAISRTALSAVGTPYVYGGTKPSEGFDCSGLVCWSYARHGLTLPRTAKAQSSMGNAVSKGGLQAGDVVVFKIRSGLHTGIYTGSGKFVHSPSSGKKVREESLDSSYWRNKFIAGRRLRQIY